MRDTFELEGNNGKPYIVKIIDETGLDDIVDISLKAYHILDDILESHNLSDYRVQSILKTVFESWKNKSETS